MIGLPDPPLESLLVEVDDGQRERYACRPRFVRSAMISMSSVVTERIAPKPKATAQSTVKFTIPVLIVPGCSFGEGQPQRRLPRVSAPGRRFQPRPFALSRFPRQQPKVTPAGTANSRSSFSCLILFTFPHGYRKVALQQPFWGDVSKFTRRRRRRDLRDVGGTRIQRCHRQRGRPGHCLLCDQRSILPATLSRNAVQSVPTTAIPDATRRRTAVLGAPVN